MWGWCGASVGAQGHLTLCALLVDGWAEAATPRLFHCDHGGGSWGLQSVPSGLVLSKGKVGRAEMPAPSFRKRPELCLGKASQSPSCVLDTCIRERCPPAEVPVPPVSPGSLPVPLGCFVSGLYLEGADWDIERGCLVKSKAKVLVVDLPILKVIPIEAHRLKLQVRGHGVPLPRFSAHCGYPPGGFMPLVGGGACGIPGLRGVTPRKMHVCTRVSAGFSVGTDSRAEAEVQTNVRRGSWLLGKFCGQCWNQKVVTAGVAGTPAVLPALDPLLMSVSGGS